MRETCFEKFPIIKSDRLIFREITDLDVDGILSIYGDPEVAEYEWFEPIESEDKALKLIRHFKKEYDSREEITWAITLKNCEEVIGYCCLGDFDRDAERCEIGYGLNKRYWNQGIVTEAIKAIIKFGFENMNLNRIEAVVTLGNDASIKVLKKADFVQEGIMRERTWMKNKLVDDVMFAILSKDYVSEKTAGI